MTIPKHLQGEVRKRSAWFILEMERNADGWIPCIAVEGQGGYYRSSKRWKCTREAAERMAAELNRTIQGLSDKDVEQITKKARGS